MENILQEIICKLRYKTFFFCLKMCYLLNEINYSRNVRMSCRFCSSCIIVLKCSTGFGRCITERPRYCRLNKAVINMYFIT